MVLSVGARGALRVAGMALGLGILLPRHAGAQSAPPSAPPPSAAYDVEPEPATPNAAPATTSTPPVPPVDAANPGGPSLPSPAPAAPPPVTPMPAASPGPRSAPPPAIYEPPPPPLTNPDRPFRPLLSFRVDPLTWLLEGRLGIELESQVYKFISVELVPVFVTTDKPPVLRHSFGGPEVLSQHSNGIGALAGTSIGAGFWLNGEPMRGTVFRIIYANYGYRFEASDALGTFDRVAHTDRHLYGYIGSHSRYGMFTIAGGFGIGVELNREQRCFPDPVRLDRTSSACSSDEQLISLTRTLSNNDYRVADLHSWTYPIEFMARFSLGVSF